MDKIILKDGTTLEFSKVEGLNVNFTNKTVEELEKVFTKENCIKVQLSKSTGEVYGIYNSLECTSITKNLEDSMVTVNLRQVDDISARVETLENAVGDLGTVVSELSEGGIK